MTALVAIGALGLAACGTEVLDRDGAEDFVKEQLEAGGNARIGTVQCPDDVEVEADATFKCRAESRDGALSTTVTIRQLDDDGNVRIEDVAFDE